MALSPRPGAGATMSFALEETVESDWVAVRPHVFDEREKHKFVFIVAWNEIEGKFAITCHNRTAQRQRSGTRDQAGARGGAESGALASDGDSRAGQPRRARVGPRPLPPRLWAGARSRRRPAWPEGKLSAERHAASWGTRRRGVRPARRRVLSGARWGPTTARSEGLRRQRCGGVRCAASGGQGGPDVGAGSERLRDGHRGDRGAGSGEGRWGDPAAPALSAAEQPPPAAELERPAEEWQPGSLLPGSARRAPAAVLRELAAGAVPAGVSGGAVGHVDGAVRGAPEMSEQEIDTLCYQLQGLPGPRPGHLRLERSCPRCCSPRPTTRRSITKAWASCGRRATKKCSSGPGSASRR